MLFPSLLSAFGGVSLDSWDLCSPLPLQYPTMLFLPAQGKLVLSDSCIPQRYLHHLTTNMAKKGAKKAAAEAPKAMKAMKAKKA